MTGPEIDHLVEQATMAIFGQPGMVTGFVVVASIQDVEGETRYIIGHSENQALHVSLGLLDIAQHYQFGEEDD